MSYIRITRIAEVNIDDSEALDDEISKIISADDEGALEYGVQYTLLNDDGLVIEEDLEIK